MQSNSERWAEMRAQLREARLASGQRQEDVAQAMTPGEPALGGRHSWVSRLEGGKAVPHIDTAIGWARALGREIVMTDRRVAPLAQLDPGEVATLLRVAHGAVNYLPPLEAYRLRIVLAKLAPAERPVQ